jgi:hypothetical protein
MDRQTRQGKGIFAFAIGKNWLLVGQIFHTPAGDFRLSTSTCLIAQINQAVTGAGRQQQDESITRNGLFCSFADVGDCWLSRPI